MGEMSSRADSRLFDGKGHSGVIEIVVCTIGAVAIAAFRYLTARVFVKKANKKDIPAIARAMYPRLQLGRGQSPDQEAPNGDSEPGE